MKRILLVAHCILLLNFASNAQRYLGVATGNYNAMNSMYLNPANLGGCNERLSVYLFSVNMGVDNSLGTISSIGSISKTLGSNDSGGKNIFSFSNSSKFSMMVPSVEIRGPGLLYSINSRHTVALLTRVRAFNEFNNFDRSLYSAITDPASATQGNIAFNTQNFNWTAHVWSEIGLSYGAVLVDQDMFQLKAGVSLRYLMGVGYLGLKGKNLNVTYKNGSDSIHTTNSDIEFASNVQSLSDAFTNGVSTDKLFGGSTAGKGLGTDLGLSFVYRGDDNNESGNGYKLAFSAAITDLGSINYKSSYNVNVKGDGYLSGNGIKDNVKDYEDFRAYVKTQGYSVDTSTKSNKVYLPTAFVISGDYHALKKIFINATLIANVANPQNFGSQYYSQLTITPRYDSKILSAGLPITFNMLTHNMRMGLGFRVSGFFLGSDDMLALFSDHQYGFNFYIGALVPFYRKIERNQFKFH